MHAGTGRRRCVGESFSMITIIQRLVDSLFSLPRTTIPSSAHRKAKQTNNQSINQSIKHVYTIITLIACSNSLFITRRQPFLTTSSPFWRRPRYHDFERHLPTRSTSRAHRRIRTEVLPLWLLRLLLRWSRCQHLLSILHCSSTSR